MIGSRDDSLVKLGREHKTKKQKYGLLKNKMWLMMMFRDFRGWCKPRLDTGVNKVCKLFNYNNSQID